MCNQILADHPETAIGLDPATGRPIIGRCVYCGCSDPDEPYVHCYEHEVIVRLWCSDLHACDERQEREAQAMADGPMCCPDSQARRVRQEVAQCWAERATEAA